MNESRCLLNINFFVYYSYTYSPTYIFFSFLFIYYI